jgi:uncharacterized membrane protein YhaH (DUF805 family)
MHVLTLFLSFRGRAGRAGYWLVSLTWLVLASVLSYVWTEIGASDFQIGRNHLGDAALVLILLPLLVSCVAVCVTRLHDRNKSAGWLFLFAFCPALIETIASLGDLDSGLMVSLMVLSRVILIWGFVELACLRGTRGPNRFGPDPLSGAAAAPA